MAFVLPCAHLQVESRRHLGQTFHALCRHLNIVQFIIRRHIFWSQNYCWQQSAPTQLVILHDIIIKVDTYPTTGHSSWYYRNGQMYRFFQVLPLHRVFHVGGIPWNPKKSLRELLHYTNLSSGFAATLSLTMLANFSSRAFNSSTEASMSKSSCILSCLRLLNNWNIMMTCPDVLGHEAPHLCRPQARDACYTWVILVIPEVQVV